MAAHNFCSTSILGTLSQRTTQDNEFPGQGMESGMMDRLDIRTVIIIQCDMFVDQRIS